MAATYLNDSLIASYSVKTFWWTFKENAFRSRRTNSLLLLWKLQSTFKSTKTNKVSGLKLNDVKCVQIKHCTISMTDCTVKSHQVDNIKTGIKSSDNKTTFVLGVGGGRLTNPNYIHEKTTVKLPCCVIKQSGSKLNATKDTILSQCLAIADLLPRWTQLIMLCGLTGWQKHSQSPKRRRLHILN
jgi:hypothetical protein